MFRKEIILNDTNIVEGGYLFHARSGKNVSISIHDDKYPYIKYLTNLMQKLNQRIGKKYQFSKILESCSKFEINVVS